MALRLQIGTTDYRAGNLPQSIVARGSNTGVSTLRVGWNLKRTAAPIAGGQAAIDNTAVWFGPVTVGADANKPLFRGQMTGPRAVPYPGDRATHWRPAAKGLEHSIRRRMVPPDPVAAGFPRPELSGTHAAVVESIRAAYLSDVVTSVTGLSTTEVHTGLLRRGTLAANLDRIGAQIGATWRIRPDGVMHWTYTAATTPDLTLASRDIQAAEDSTIETDYANSLYVWQEDPPERVQVHVTHAAEIARVGQIDRTVRVPFDPVVPAVWGDLPGDPNGDSAAAVQRGAYDPDTDWLWASGTGTIYGIRLSDMTVQREIAFGDSGQRNVAVSADRVYAVNDQSGSIASFRKSDGVRQDGETIGGIAQWNFRGLFYERSSGLMWAVLNRRNRQNVWTRDIADSSATWTNRFQLPEPANVQGGVLGHYTGIVLAGDSVFSAVVSNPVSKVIQFTTAGTYVRTYDLPALNPGSGLAGDYRGGRLFYRHGGDKLGYIRPLGMSSHLQAEADAILAQSARTVRRLSLTLRPRDNLLPLPYVSLVSVPAGAWGAAGNWHVQSWETALDVATGWVHRLDLTSYPRAADTRIWQGLAG